MKPIGKKNYGSIPHLPGSKLGAGDYHIHEGQAVIVTEKARDIWDTVIITEKCDGSNVGIANIDGNILALTRSGYLANTSKYGQHHAFAEWVRRNEIRFRRSIDPGWRLVGEWLMMAHGTKYELSTEPFYAFDYMNGVVRADYITMCRIAATVGVPTTPLIHIGQPVSVERINKVSGESSIIDPKAKREGLVYKVERFGKVDFLCKWVRFDYEPGKYFKDKDEVYNKLPANCQYLVDVAKNYR